MNTDEQKEQERNLALCLAAERGCVEDVRALIAEGANINGDEENGAPLAFAADEGHAEVVRLLLAAGAEPGCYGSGGSALYNAVCADSLECLRLLLEHGATLENARDADDKSLLQLAAENDNIPMVQLLLELGEDVNAMGGDHETSALMDAVDEGASATMVELLIAAGADLELRGGWRDNTALLVAAEVHNRGAFNALLDAGANMQVVNRIGDSPLSIAAEREDEYATALLLAHGCPPEWEGHAPLLAAAECGSQRVAKRLLEAGASLEVQNEDGYTPFDLAVAYGQVSMARFLLARGAAPTGEGRPAGGLLLLAAHEGNLPALRRELDAGADINTSLLSGRETALHIAAESGAESLAAFLLERGANVGASCCHGMQPLHVAVRSGRSAIVRLLLAYGANPDAMDGERRSCLRAAIERDRADIADMLLEAGARPTIGEGKGARHAMLLATECRSVDCMRVLRHHGRVEPATLRLCWYELLDALARGHDYGAMADILLSAGASPHLCPEGKRSLLELLPHKKLPLTTAALRQHGYDC